MMPAPHSADLRWRVIWFVMLRRGQLAVRKAVSVGNFKQTGRRVSAIIFQLFKVFQLFSHYAWKMPFNYPGIKLKPALGQDKVEHLSSYAHVVHTTAKKVISRHRKNENVFKMSKDGKCTCKVCKSTGFHCEICKLVGFVLPSSSWLLKLSSLAPREELIVVAY